MAENSESSRPGSTYWLTRFVILRWLGFVYAVAFLVAAFQILPLVGSDGLLPVGAFLERVRVFTGSSAAGFVQLPSLFWLNHSDALLLGAAWAGFALSLLVFAGYANAILLAILWALYMSFVHIGQDWYGYGWEIQLLETGFLAIFLCPLVDGRPFPRRAPPIAVLWLFRWLIFRIMLGAGLIKIRGDPAWRDLTALFYHFETQPLPNPLSRWFHFLPRGVLRGGVLFNHLVELVAPFFVFWPWSARWTAGALIILFQLVLILSGNLSFLNWLTILPALACFDDRFWKRILPRWLIQKAENAARNVQPSQPMEAASWVLAVIIGVLSIQPVSNLFSSRQIMNTAFDPLNLVNTYGAFGTVGRERYNVVFEGTASANPGDEEGWKEYPYKGLPVALDERPPQVAPYQLRLDWQMWFAAMGSPLEYNWTLFFCWKLLHNDPGALSLLRDNPFPSKPPRYVRAVLYRYEFAPPNDPQGRYWKREKIRNWLPPLAADDPGFIGLLREYGWSVPEETRRE